MKSRAILLRTFIFALLWLALTGGAEGAWIYGAVAAVAAGALSLGLYPADRQGVQIWRAALFAPTLLARGFLGGLDVARRAIDPRLPIQPGWIRFRLGNRNDEANALLGGVISVLPGTLSAGPQDGQMDVHVLNSSGFDLAELATEERRVLGLFGRRITGRKDEHA